MRLFTRAIRTMSVLALAAAGATLAAGGASAASDVVGHLYVDDNTAGTNTIAAFDRHADGTLTPLHGSPFVAGGAGTGTGIGSQGALQITSGGKYLLAVDAGSNQVSVLRIDSDGGLRPVGGGPQPCPRPRHGARPVDRGRAPAGQRRGGLVRAGPAPGGAVLPPGSGSPLRRPTELAEESETS